MWGEWKEHLHLPSSPGGPLDEYLNPGMQDPVPRLQGVTLDQWFHPLPRSTTPHFLLDT